MGKLVISHESASPSSPASGKNSIYPLSTNKALYYKDESANELNLFGADYQTIASSATTDLGSKNSNILEITGNTLITSFGGNTSVTRGSIFLLNFASNISITANATTMIIPWMSTGNLSVLANDRLLVHKESDSVANWRILAHFKNNGMGARETAQTLTDAATVNWDAGLGHIATVTLAGNRTMAAPTNLVPGTMILKVIQDGTGGRTLSWNSVFKWASASAPVLSTGSGSIDVLTFYCDGTNLYGTIQKAFA